MNFDRLQEIFLRFGDGFKKMRIDTLEGNMDIDDYIKIIQLMPNLEMLYVNIDQVPPSEKFHNYVGGRLQPDKTFEALELHKLKQISIEQMESSTLLNQISARNLEACYFHKTVFQPGVITFVSKNNSIKKLQLYNFVELDSLQLTHLALRARTHELREYPDNFLNIQNVCSSQRFHEMMLSQLHLIAISIDVKYFKFVPDEFCRSIFLLRQLQILEISVSLISVDTVARIARLKCLQQLHIANLNQAQIPLLSSESVERLEFSVQENLSVANLNVIARNFPQVSVLNLTLTEQKISSFIRLEDVLEAFEKLEILYLLNSSESKRSFIKILVSRGKIFPNLKKLHVKDAWLFDNESFQGEIVGNLLEALPNLINLSLEHPNTICKQTFDNGIGDHQQLLHFALGNAELYSYDNLIELEILTEFVKKLHSFRMTFKNAYVAGHLQKNVSNLKIHNMENGLQLVFKESQEHYQSYCPTFFEPFNFIRQINRL